jgi:hypothetical protein
MAFSHLTDDQLKVVIKSLSITYDATSKKMERLHGHHYDEALGEVELCDAVLAMAKAEQAQRWRSAAS